MAEPPPASTRPPSGRRSAAPPGAGRDAPARAVRRRPGPGRDHDLRGRRPVPGLVQAPGHRRDGGAAGRPGRAGRAAPADRRHVRRRAHQRHRGPGRAAPPCAPPRAARSFSTATTSCPRSTRCWAGCAASPTRSAPAAGWATPAGRSATSSTSASAAPTWARPWPMRRCCPTATGRGRSGSSPTSTGPTSPRRPRPGPGRDPVRGLLQDLHHHRDPDQRPHRPGLAAGRPRRRGGRVPPLRGRVHQRREGGRVRHRPGQHVRLLGLVGAATPTRRRSGCR